MEFEEPILSRRQRNKEHAAMLTPDAESVNGVTLRDARTELQNKGDSSNVLYEDDKRGRHRHKARNKCMAMIDVMLLWFTRRSGVASLVSSTILPTRVAEQLAKKLKSVTFEMVEAIMDSLLTPYGSVFWEHVYWLVVQRCVRGTSFVIALADVQYPGQRHGSLTQKNCYDMANNDTLVLRTLELMGVRRDTVNMRVLVGKTKVQIASVRRDRNINRADPNTYQDRATVNVTNTSGANGVYRTTNGAWRVRVRMSNGDGPTRYYSLKGMLFDDKKEAARAFDICVLRLGLMRRRRNYPDEKYNLLEKIPNSRADKKPALVLAQRKKRSNTLAAAKKQRVGPWEVLKKKALKEDAANQKKWMVMQKNGEVKGVTYMPRKKTTFLNNQNIVFYFSKKSGTGTYGMCTARFKVKSRCGVKSPGTYHDPRAAALRADQVLDIIKAFPSARWANNNKNNKGTYYENFYKNLQKNFPNVNTSKELATIQRQKERVNKARKKIVLATQTAIRREQERAGLAAPKKRKLRTTNKSGYRGVTVCVYNDEKFVARFGQKQLGVFSSKRKAANAYDRAATAAGRPSNTLNYPKRQRT